MATPRLSAVFTLPVAHARAELADPFEIGLRHLNLTSIPATPKTESRLRKNEDENGTTFEYDKPSTLFAQFHDPKIDEASHSLDDRLAALLAAVAR